MKNPHRHRSSGDNVKINASQLSAKLLSFFALCVCVCFVGAGGNDCKICGCAIVGLRKIFR